MPTRSFRLAVLISAIVTVALSASIPRQQSAVIRFAHPTWVADTLLIGSYVIVHDDARMAQGEPCTVIYPVGAPQCAGHEVVAFHCVPHTTLPAGTFKMTLRTDAAHDTDSLTDYQFAGDAEGHGVPTANATMAPFDDLPR